MSAQDKALQEKKKAKMSRMMEAGGTMADRSHADKVVLKRTEESKNCKLIKITS